MAIDPTPHLLIPSCADCAAMGLHVADFLLEMEAELGVEAVRDFLMIYGGREISIPTKREVGPDKGAPLTQREWLIDTIGWGKLRLPKGPTSQRARTSFTVLSMRRDGSSIRQIATATGLHSRTVEKTLQRLVERGVLNQPQSS